MEITSIILPQKLGKKLRDKAEEIDSLPEELAIEILFKGLGEELDPEDLLEHYQALSDKYFKEAKEFLSKGDLVQASEKLWGVTALAVKAVAAKRGLKLERHGSLWDFVSKLSKESRDKDILRFFHTANSLHRNFYENQMNREAIEIAIEDIERLIIKLKGIS
ncbi:MAG: hypothetical protein AMJ45_06645 [Syntrophobacter sp. DG_60]|nr:MAG: hypothetical protein AMJ45_06645 [Syntrophobacter sp. DG_60]